MFKISITPIRSKNPIIPEIIIGTKNAIDAVLKSSNHQVTRKLKDNGTNIANIVQPTIRDRTSRRIITSHLELLLQIVNSVRR